MTSEGAEPLELQTLFPCVCFNNRCVCSQSQRCKKTSRLSLLGAAWGGARFLKNSLQIVEVDYFLNGLFPKKDLFVVLR